MLDEYQIHPWQMERWTGGELKELFRYHRMKAQQQQQEQG